MLQQIKRLGTETAIYGIGTIAGRFLNFILVPFYTNVLAPAEYGVVAYLYSLIAFTNILYWYGMEAAYFKFATDTGPPGDAGAGTAEGGGRGAMPSRAYFSTPFLSMVGSSLLLSLLIFAFRGTISSWIGVTPGHEVLISYTAGILFLDAVAVIPFAFLRLARMAKMFTWVKFLGILTNVMLNVVLLLKYGAGVEGIFISGLIASGVTLLMLVPVIAGEFRPRFDGKMLRAMLKYCLPTVPAGLALMALQVVDRPILRALTDDATVGIYQANYRLGIFMMIAVSVYDYAWRPFFFSHASEPDAKKMFARVMTYVVLIFSVIFFAFTFFLPDIVRIEFGDHHFIHPKYWEGLGIVPVVMMGYVFLGISTNLSAGIYLRKKTHYLPMINVTGAVANVGLNFLLIPRFGIAGAAWATLLAYLAMAVVLYVVVERVYPVEYEKDRLWKIFDVAALFLVAYHFLPDDTPWTLPVKLLLFGAYPMALYSLGVFRVGEIAAVKGLFRRRGN
jgi:O-antigen/teichoic acid export membrane protein